MWKIWVRNSCRSKWRMLQTRDFRDYWEANIYIDKRFDDRLNKEEEAVPLLDGETPWICETTKHWK